MFLIQKKIGYENKDRKYRKKVYCVPHIERITLENEISLTLESPDVPPEWSENKEIYNNDPFKTIEG